MTYDGGPEPQKRFFRYRFMYVFVCMCVRLNVCWSLRRSLPYSRANPIAAPTPPTLLLCLLLTLTSPSSVDPLAWRVFAAALCLCVRMCVSVCVVVAIQCCCFY